MEHIRTLSIALALTACVPMTAISVTTATERQEKTDMQVKNSVMNDIERYFLNGLNGKTDIKTVNIKKKLNLSEVASARQQVWEAWKTANQRFEEDKLPVLVPYSGDNVYRWPLPATLEPDAVMPFYWGRKGENKPDAGWPLFIYLHGSGPKDSEWAAGLSLSTQFDDAPSVYFLPQIPNEGAYYRWYQKAKQFAWERLLRQAFITGEFNPNRVYVYGISEGGYGSQRLASFYGDYWAAAGPMAGGDILRNAPVENCSNLAFSLRTGAKDYMFGRDSLTLQAAYLFDSLQSRYPGEFIHNIELIPGYGHGIDYFPTTPWLKHYVRNPYPLHVLWEDFEMDGNYRKGFFNIKVDERNGIEEKARTRYEMTIRGNDIDLRVDRVEYVVLTREPRWNIEIKTDKILTPLNEGKFTVYLCNELVDLNQKVRLTVNGKQVFYGKVKPELKHLVNSCATFFDPCRLYPAAIEVEL